MPYIRPSIYRSARPSVRPSIWPSIILMLVCIRPCFYVITMVLRSQRFNKEMFCLPMAAKVTKPSRLFQTEQFRVKQLRLFCEAISIVLRSNCNCFAKQLQLFHEAIVKSFNLFQWLRDCHEAIAIVSD